MTSEERMFQVHWAIAECLILAEASHYEKIPDEKTQALLIDSACGIVKSIWDELVPNQDGAPMPTGLKQRFHVRVLERALAIAKGEERL